ncbi:hypothetical protein ATANTOWER_026022 [Ataeniobius toweri]|uniref:Uncharacterized protein n=1 Tax=Ataeniobius toweri TaxID=208326 RepID=A0ABU7AH57_9TELE|nr:hypothetical protein [Ataeniobius toweri]
MKKYGESSDDASAFKTASAAKEATSIQQMDGPLALEKFSDELREMKKMIALLNSDKREDKSDYWIKLTGRINKIFGICYVISVVVFLATIFSVWLREDDYLCETNHLQVS